MAGKRNISSSSLGEAPEEPEVGIDADELLDETRASGGGDDMQELGDDDEKSSTYSHPSLLDGAINFSASARPVFSAILSSTPENGLLLPASSSCRELLLPQEESSTEVVVHRRKRLSRYISSSSDGSSDRPRSRSQASLAKDIDANIASCCDLSTSEPTERVSCTHF